MADNAEKKRITPWAGSSAYRTDSVGRYHWCRVIYGVSKHVEMGRAVSITGLYHCGLICILHYARNGEMLYLEPVAGSFAVYAHKYLSPYFGYLTAWGYWFMWIAVGISEITAIGVYVQFWFPEIPQWLPAIAGVAIVALANLAAVKLYGELEFWFAMIKVTTIIVMILVGLGVIFFWLR